ncbi:MULTISPECIES: OsmC family protein [unclassified Micromonospora]|uniref:OsmC family protein n=1 Tax=unclassified Micromonospora TaxID=2617518 RepID=UPI0036C1646F|nr:OsmC family protein [Micromonospora sp. NBC_00858]
MPVRNSSAQWKGDLAHGTGTMTLASKAYSGPYSFTSRFEEGTGTNPEELIAAAHAGCFSMAFSHMLAEAGYTPTSVETTASVHIDPADGGFAISRITLSAKATVPGIDNAQFEKIAETAKVNCPVSQALAAVDITLSAKLV